MPVKVVSQEQALQAFKALDVDNSGALTAAELSKILMRPGDEAFSEEEATAKAKELIEKRFRRRRSEDGASTSGDGY